MTLLCLKQRHYFANKGPSSQGYGFSSSHVWMWELDYKESWAWKKWCFWTMVLEKTLESPLDCKEIQPVHPKRDQSWVCIGRIDAEAEAPVLWPPYVKIWLIWKDPDAGKDGRQEERGMTEDEMVGWHHWLNGDGFGWTLGVGDGQGGLACYGSWGRRVGHDWVTELNWTVEFGEGNSNPLQYSCLENPMDRGAWWATVHRLQRVGHKWAAEHIIKFNWKIISIIYVILKNLKFSLFFQLEHCWYS